MPTVNVSVDPVELELVRADIAMEKARLKANGDWSKWEELQTQTNAMLAAHSAPLDWRARERLVLWWAFETLKLSRLMAPPRRPRRLGWPFR